MPRVGAVHPITETSRGGAGLHADHARRQPRRKRQQLPTLRGPPQHDLARRIDGVKLKTFLARSIPMVAIAVFAVSLSMDGAPLMIRFDNDHHGRFDAEGGRRPPHHRNSVHPALWPPLFRRPSLRVTEPRVMQTVRSVAMPRPAAELEPWLSGRAERIAAISRAYEFQCLPAALDELLLLVPLRPIGLASRGGILQFEPADQALFARPRQHARHDRPADAHQPADVGLRQTEFPVPDDGGIALGGAAVEDA
jgi:hypothetical protein